ncbi:MAG: DUF1501 domain-containing protein [Planctomycetia bacterium]|nr:DUF1501 domain-containing protein [Planctomycetia bacterium]
MSLTRREALKLGGLGAASLMVPGWLTRALAEPAAARSKRVLVLVVLSGGNDGLNTVVPLSDPRYAKARPTLAIPRDQMLPLDDTVGLAPPLRKLRELYEKGRVAIVNNAGYPNHDRSHFRSMEIWQTAQTEGVVRDGWLGRCLCDDGSAPHSVAFGSETPLALWAEGGGVMAMENPGGFEITTDIRRPNDRANVLSALRDLYGSGRSGAAEFVRLRGLEVMAQADRVRSIAQKPPSPVPYPNFPLAQQLRFVADAVEDGFPARVYLVTLGGFDTHANQRGAHTALLATFSEAVATFQRDLEARELAGRVVTLAFSEFGRRVAENVSQGTDHGAAGPMFVIGKGVRGGLYGGAPDLEKLDSGDLAMKVDFRAVYAEILGKAMGIPPAKALGGDFKEIGFL